jgi:GNAT superfamily N-acetyltransferase
VSAVPPVRRLAPREFADAVPALADLLVDAVAGGASLGFLAPLGHAEAATWWQSKAAAVDAGDLVVWVADSVVDAAGGDCQGTVSLSFDRIANGRHRSHVSKLMVHRGARGRGLGRALLDTAEQAAAAAGSTLLLLDTETGSPAEHLYRRAGWTSYGVVPRYASDPSGALRDCTFFSKELPA